MKIYPSNPVCTNKNMYSALTDFTFKFVFFDLSLTIHTMGFLLLFLIAKHFVLTLLPLLNVHHSFVAK